MIHRVGLGMTTMQGTRRRFSLFAASILLLACGNDRANDTAASPGNGGASTNGGGASSGDSASSGGSSVGAATSAGANGGAVNLGSGGSAKGGTGASTGGDAASGSVGKGGSDGSSGTTSADAGDASTAAGSGNTAGGSSCESESDDDEIVATEEKFSFFVTSLAAMRSLSGSQDGFGGDLRFGETGPGAGLRGADKICRTIAESSMPGAGHKGWHAFLSARSDGCGSGPVHAIDRIGNGPWYDRVGRLVAQDREALLGERPQGAETAIVEDLPNEDGVPNHSGGSLDCARNQCPDNHDTLTGSDESGKLYVVNTKDTCEDWTSAEKTGGRPVVGHSWSSASSGKNWITAHWALGCLPGVIDPTRVEIVASVGFSGGYGGIYCFASTP